MLTTRCRRSPPVQYFPRPGTPPLGRDLEISDYLHRPGCKSKKKIESSVGGEFRIMQRHARLRRRLSILPSHPSHLPQDQVMFSSLSIEDGAPLHSLPLPPFHTPFILSIHTPRLRWLEVSRSRGRSPYQGR